jgi:hypothetical protein
MNFKYTYKYIFLVLFLLINVAAWSQTTVVTGKVTDGSNKNGLSYVSVAFVGSNIGVTTDANGDYTLRTIQPYTKIKASYIGFKDATHNVVPGKEQVINIRMVPSSTQLNEVSIKTTKKQNTITITQRLH